MENETSGASPQGNNLIDITGLRPRQEAKNEVAIHIHDSIENTAIEIISSVLGRAPISVGEWNGWKTLFIAIQERVRISNIDKQETINNCRVEYLRLYKSCWHRANELFNEVRDEHYIFINNRFIELKKIK